MQIMQKKSLLVIKTYHENTLIRTAVCDSMKNNVNNPRNRIINYLFCYLLHGVSESESFVVVTDIDNVTDRRTAATSHLIGLLRFYTELADMVGLLQSFLEVISFRVGEMKIFFVVKSETIKMST